MATKSPRRSKREPLHAQARLGVQGCLVRGRRGSGRTRIKLGEAMRVLGLDESKLAEKLKRMVGRLDKAKSDKMLLEVLKECGKLLEAYPAPARSFGAGHEPVPVELVHYVPRPPRASGSEPTADENRE